MHYKTEYKVMHFERKKVSKIELSMVLAPAIRHSHSSQMCVCGGGGGEGTPIGRYTS